MRDASWQEHVLTRVPWPINAEPVDLDGDGDLDIVAGSVAERRMMWFENTSQDGGFEFHEHPVTLTPAATEIKDLTVHAFNMDYVDLNGDGRLDIVTMDTPPLLGRRLLWLEQPASASSAWRYHLIDHYGPDTIVGIRVADIDSDGDPDIMTGGYSGMSGPSATGESARISDVPTPNGTLGRLAWYENAGRMGDEWIRHDFSRRQRGMFDMFIARDLDADGDIDFASTRGNSGVYDGVFWLEQVRSETPIAAFKQARDTESPEVAIPAQQ